LPGRAGFVTIVSAMRAAVLRKIGAVPRLEDFPDPVASEDEVLVTVLAASLKPIDRQLAAGTHFASPREFPVVCGSDGMGRLPDGSRVFYGGPRRPHGSFAERTVVRRAQCFPVPDNLDDATAAAIPNPGVSAWLSLSHRAKLVPGETVLILGATGVTGKLAVQIAKILGASRVVAAGRNPEALASLPVLGADTTLSLNQPRESLTEAFRRENSARRFDVIIDYVWGTPTETLLAALTTHEFAAGGRETRLVQVGESAAPTIQLGAAALRSTALTLMGTAGIPAMDVLSAALTQVLGLAGNGQLRIETEQLPLSEVEAAWGRPASSRRLVFRP
jgi:NADPH:quinone reductase-like Zn-dependent oxidoreductase